MAAAGLAGMILAMPALALTMKALGSLYLLWLAWKIGCSGPPHTESSFTKPTGFITGVWVLWQNPKTWAMTISASASFSVLSNGPAGLALLLGGTFALAASISLSLWCQAGQLLARYLRTPRQWRMLNATLGGFIVASILFMWLS